MRALKLFVVAERSMAPTLLPGDGLVAVPLRRPEIGAIVIAPLPHAADFWLVKRITGLAGDVVDVGGRQWPVGAGEMFLASDDPSVTRADSRTYGPLPVAGAYRVVLRVPARLLGR